MMRALLFAIAMLFSIPAFAQQPMQTPMERALGAQLMEQINSNIQLRAQLELANDKIKELQDKAKPPEAKK